MTSDVGARKRALRAEIKARRRATPNHEQEHATAALTENLIDLARQLGVRSISAYLSTASEPNVRPFLNWAEERGIRLLFPIVREDGLLDWAVGDGRTEKEGLFGVPEPVGEVLNPMAIGEVDLILVPAACIDQRGMRMGWGRGYFDKTLGSMQKRPPVYAVVFDAEFVDEVPTEVHDQPVDGVVTPSGIVAF